ncbi:hypothetical protein DIURU_005555 [Diutina rugosa]|uniref:Cytochrome c oxidase assembly protein COX20, mitochondrial n=1 Tax=Diutina rugosa TaxID=5481 RepID=A0A642UCP0_DIURU|nr:uncharacterized protein DIURU_005555 [Diutina rugosa]KAA8896815.1 hypothetical protein DIURU_005555 [Diutina rugosa]
MPFETSQEVRDRRAREYHSVMLVSATRGVLEGTIIGLLSGALLMYRYNHGVNRKFFHTSYKVAYMACWDLAGMTWRMDEAKQKLRKQALVENQLRQDAYMNQEFYGRK